MSLTTREQIATALHKKCNFALRIPSAAIVLRPIYCFEVNDLAIGDMVACAPTNSSWLDVGQITSSKMTRPEAEIQITMTLLPRLSEKSMFYSITVPASHVICRWERVDACETK